MNMIFKNPLITIIVWLFISARHASAECNVCAAATQVACISETQYQNCINNIPSPPVNTCPTNYVCSTATSVICQPVGSIVPTCSGCNTCDSSLTFACTGTNTYSLCLGTNTPTVPGNCGANLVCNINNPQICGTGLTPTCSSSVITTTTTAPPITIPTYAQYACQIARTNRRIAFPSEIDNTCKRYIYCFLTATGTWSGQIYTCPGNTYFNPRSLYCVSTLPAGC